MKIKYLRMKISVFLTFFCVIQMTAATGFGQEKIDLEVENVPLGEILEEIKTQTGYRFFFEKGVVNLSRRISLKVHDKTVENVLTTVFGDMPVSFTILKDQVVFTRKPPEKLQPISKLRQELRPHSLSNHLQEIKQQPALITGTVTDQNGDPLVGVNIQIKGTTRGTVTDFEGRFELLNVDDNAVLVVSYIGYQTQEFDVNGQTEINIQMTEDAETLDELVVVGYGTVKKVNLSGAVDVISNEQLQDRQSPTVSQLLQGQSPGMTFSVNNNGFQPGAEMEIDIRGIGSLNGGAPLIIIDGIPGDMNRLNPDDIESISVLKDAAASAIYGARAPYGVILITTKSGSKGSKMTVTYSGSISNATPQRLPDMPDSYTYARIMNEAGENGGGRVHTNEVVDRIIAFQNGDIDYLRQFTVPDATHFETVPLANGTWGINQNANADYDWFDENYGNALNHKHNLSVQGGGESISYYFSAGLFDQEGVLNYGTDTYDRINVMGKINTKLTPWWNFTYQPRFMKSNRVLPNPQSGADYGIIFHQIARTRPNSNKYDGHGNLSVLSSKIPWLNDSGTNNYETTENIHNFSTTIKPSNGWDINLDFAYRAVDYFGSERNLTVYEYLVDKTPVPNGQTIPNYIRQSHRSANYWTTNLYTSYNFDINDNHNFILLVGYQAEANNQKILNVRKNNLLVQDIYSLQTATGDPIAAESLVHWSTLGYFSRLTYNYKEKYLMEVNIRRDGTSRFRDGNRWGTFPSVSLGWNINRESFWSSLENIINTFKIRGSWGELGNQNVSPYQDINLIPLQTSPLNWIYGYGQSRPIGYSGTPSLVSPDLTWETATSKNVGIDLSFLDNRLQTNFDWFERVTTDMIGPSEAQPGVLGASLPRANNSTLRTRGWELSVQWRHNLNSDFSYFINANLYDNRTFVTEYLNPTGTLSTWYNGKEQGEIWGYTANDLYRTQEEVESHQVDLSAIWGGDWRPGDLKYEDTNGDGVVDNGSNTLEDHGDLSIIGNSTPRYQFGISAGVNFKGFDFSMLWQGRARRDLFFNQSENILWGFGPNTTQSSPFTNHFDYFRDKEGDKYTGLYEGSDNINLDAYWPRPYLNSEGNKNKRTSTRYLQNGAYLRLQNIQLGYNVPNPVLIKLRLQKIRIYLAAENFLTFTKLSPGIDPVALQSARGVGKTYGADRIISFGLTVTY